MKETNKKRRILIWTAIIIPILGIIPAYNVFFNQKGGKLTPPAGEKTMNVEIDSSPISNSNVNIGNSNTINTDNSTNNFSTVNIYYAVSEASTSDISFSKLAPANNSIKMKTYQGTETFVRCSSDELYNFKFLNLVTQSEKILEYKIRWGDGTPDSICTTLPLNSIISHVFPEGNSIMQIEAKTRSGKVKTKSYNVFLGTNPAVGIGNKGGTEICLNEPLYFTLFGFKNNPPWTVYKLSFDDGSNPMAFVVRHRNEISVSHTFTKMPLTNYTATLEIENPCDKAIFTISPILVRKCK